MNLIAISIRHSRNNVMNISSTNTGEMKQEASVVFSMITYDLLKVVMRPGFFVFNRQMAMHFFLRIFLWSKEGLPSLFQFSIKNGRNTGAAAMRSSTWCTIAEHYSGLKQMEEQNRS